MPNLWHAILGFLLHTVNFSQNRIDSVARAFNRALDVLVVGLILSFGIGRLGYWFGWGFLEDFSTFLRVFTAFVGWFFWTYFGGLLGLNVIGVSIANSIARFIVRFIGELVPGIRTVDPPQVVTIQHGERVFRASLGALAGLQMYAILSVIVPIHRSLTLALLTGVIMQFFISAGFGWQNDTRVWLLRVQKMAYFFNAIVLGLVVISFWFTTLLPTLQRYFQHVGQDAADLMFAYPLPSFAVFGLMVLTIWLISRRVGGGSGSAAGPSHAAPAKDRTLLWLIVAVLGLGLVGWVAANHTYLWYGEGSRNAGSQTFGNSIVYGGQQQPQASAPSQPQQVSSGVVQQPTPVASQPAAVPGDYTFELQGWNSAWQRVDGGKFLLEASGHVNIGNGQLIGPEGSPQLAGSNAPAPGLPIGAVVARVENTAPFVVRSPHQFNTGGRIVYVVVNDNDYSDNGRAFTVKRSE